MNVRTLPQSGKNVVRFSTKGEIISSKELNCSKAADFYIGSYYITQKYTGENNGGAQDNQYEDVIRFLTLGSMRLQGTFGYRYGGEYLERINNIKPIFTRLLADKEPEGFITNLKLYGLDTRSEPIHINFEPQYYYGKSTDRIYATFVCSQKLNEQTQNEIATRFNNRIKAVREEYHNLLFTNYRDYNRKRISFDFAYKLLTQIVKEYENEI